VRAPGRELFDVVVAFLRAEADGVLQRVARTFDPTLSPAENLPGGKMSQAQRTFVDNVWRPRVRPALVAAGFWRVGTVGG
jgi:hypothetical protein